MSVSEEGGDEIAGVSDEEEERRSVLPTPEAREAHREDENLEEAGENLMPSSGAGDDEIAVESDENFDKTDLTYEDPGDERKALKGLNESERLLGSCNFFGYQSPEEMELEHRRDNEDMEQAVKWALSCGNGYKTWEGRPFAEPPIFNYDLFVREEVPSDEKLKVDVRG